MLQAFAVLLTFQCLGKACPTCSACRCRPVIGMLLLFGFVMLRPRVADAIEPTALELLRHLSLLFVPAGVGIMVSADRVRGDAVAVVVALAVSTTLAIAVTALVTRALLAPAARGRRGGGHAMTAFPTLGAIWVYLAATPLLGLTITLIAYLFAQAVYARARFNPLANPVLIAVALIVVLLTITRTPYPTYFEGAQFVHFLLGPATVALALPLYRQWSKLRRAAVPLLVGLLAGSLTAIVSAVGIAALFGASHQTIASLAPKSATTPIAMAVAAEIGGIPSLTAVLVISTGIFGAVCARGILNALRVDEPAVRGFALGVASHGIGTARAFQVSEEAGAFAAGMGLNGVLTAFVVPILLPVLSRWI